MMFSFFIQNHLFPAFKYQKKKIYRKSLFSSIIASIVMISILFFFHSFSVFMLSLIVGFLFLSILLYFTSKLNNLKLQLSLYILITILIAIIFLPYFYYLLSLNQNTYLILLFITVFIFASVDTSFAIPLFHILLMTPTIIMTVLYLAKSSHPLFIIILFCITVIYSTYMSIAQYWLAHQLMTNTKIQANLIRQLRKANRLKNSFVANISHELRTPLNSILGFTHLLKKENLSASASKQIEIIQQAGMHLKTLIEEILDITKLQLNKLQLQQSDNSLYEILQALYSMFIPKMQETKTTFSIICGPLIPEFLLFDSKRLFQILTNFISNSFKFTPNGSIVLNISIKKKQKSRIILNFMITDTGTGIPPNIQHSIFEPFITNTTTTQNIEGIGLGLNIAKQLIFLMNGSIELNKTDDHGTTFTITLPFGLSELSVIPHYSTLKKKKGLLFLQNSQEREMIKKILFTQECHFFITYSINDLENYLTSNLDFIILNLQSIDNKIATILHNHNIPIILLLDQLDYTHSLIEDYKQNILFIQRPIFPGLFLKQFNTFLNHKTTKLNFDKLQEETHSFDFSGISILVAEDNKWNQMLIKKLLESQGAIVTIANNGKTVVEIFHDQHFDLILMDIMMPIIDGYEATKIIRKEEKNLNKSPIPIIGLTAKSTKEEEDKGYLSGLNGYIEKPIEPSFLFKTLSDFISLKNPSVKNSNIEFPQNQKFLDFLDDIRKDKELFESFQSSILTTLPQTIMELRQSANLKKSEDIKFKTHYIKNIVLYLKDEQLTQYFIDIENNATHTNTILSLLDNAQIKLQYYTKIIKNKNFDF